MLFIGMMRMEEVNLMEAVYLFDFVGMVLKCWIGIDGEVICWVGHDRFGCLVG